MLIKKILSRPGLSYLIAVAILFAGCSGSSGTNTVPIVVKENSPGAPQLFGIPFPEGALDSPDNVRLVNEDGVEVPSQITEVSTWEPSDNSVKWIWVFFFTEDASEYKLEYGNDISRSHTFEKEIAVTNNQREGGFVSVDTGPLRFKINQGKGGFFDYAALDVEENGFDSTDVIARGDSLRGSFLDILDDAGIDRSRAVVRRTFKEKGSGPLHAIIRVEGEYQYDRKDNNASPFIIRIHAYAGKSYVRVLHTLTYTGNPDKHTKPEGEYAAIATEEGRIIDQEELKGDPGWTEPNDQIAAAGLSLNYNLSDERKYTTSYYDGSWTEPGERKFLSQALEPSDEASIWQTGPDTYKGSSFRGSASEQETDSTFEAGLKAGSEEIDKERVPGWMDISDQKWGISVGIRHFLEEYPKEIKIPGNGKEIRAYFWSPKAGPMSFERASREEDSGMVANFAQGLTKTSEAVYHFHKGDASQQNIEQTINYFLNPPVTHADPAWYAESEVYGNMASHSKYDSFERGLDYKFNWILYNQHHQPWYGMFNYGDGLTYYFNDRWFQWTNNEPGNDYMWWMQFIRTGNRDYYLAAQAASEHTMDVDNIHWPRFPEYYGDTNDALDVWKKNGKPPGTPYLGMGRRHARQHWTSQLSAHVWVMGWVASYYLDGNHRGLEVAEQTGDYYKRRIFGDHGLRGRRLYLSVWNLAEIWDATKKKTYFDELKDRVNLMLELQKDANQGGELVINRYGYTQVYASHGLRKYYQLMGDEEVREALVTHARRVRDVPPLNHQMESYLSTIHSLLTGFEFTGEKSFYEEALSRAEVLKTEKLTRPVASFESTKTLADSLEAVSYLPPDPTSPFPPIWKMTNGLRVFGWTHMYNVPYLVYWLDEEGHAVN